MTERERSSNLYEPPSYSFLSIYLTLGYIYNSPNCIYLAFIKEPRRVNRIILV